MIRLFAFGAPPTNAGRTWDEKYRADGPEQSAPGSYLAQPFVRTLLRHVLPGMRVLDAGCGSGGLARVLTARGLKVTGVDTSEAAVAVAQRRAPGAEFRVASIEELPFPDASFDAYVAIGSWEYPAGGPARSATEAARVLKPDGLCLVEVPRLNALRRFAYVPLKKLEGFVGDILRSPRRFKHHLFALGDLRDLLTRTGFLVLEEHPHDLPEPTRHYGLWVDWPFLRGGPHYELNALGRAVKRLGCAISPWTIATGVCTVARKR